MERSLGKIVLFGSGEISSHAQPIYARLMASLPRPITVSILETPAGFQLNSAQVAGEIGEYLEHHLQNYAPIVHVIPARKKGQELGPDNPSIISPLYASSMMFFGPGSPTYASRQLRGTLAWDVVRARHQLGAALVAASAATIAMSKYALPVYEIYKVGEDLHWQDGLDFCAAYGLSLVVVPHWNNNDGGDTHDTSRCFMGRPRFKRLLDMLPADVGVLGIDELTALLVEPEETSCSVLGMGGVTIMAPETRETTVFSSGSSFSMKELGPCRAPRGGEGIAPDVWAEAVAAQMRLSAPREPSAEAKALLADRAAARAERNWAESDRLRDELAEMDWQVRDTPDGQEMVPVN